MRTIFFILFLSLSASSVSATIIPLARRMTWQGNVGVVGGIPARTTIFTNFGTNATADDISAALNACPSNQVVMLTNGTFTLTNQIRALGPSHATLRGHGQGATIITTGGSYSGSAVVSLGNYPWITEWTATNALSSNASEGDTTISVSATNGVQVGRLMIVEMDNVAGEHFGFGSGGGGGPAGNSAGRLRDGDRVQAQHVMVTAMTSSTITFDPPLNFNFTTSRNARCLGSPYTGPVRIGLEELTINVGNTNLMGVWIFGGYQCWLKNVELKGWGTFGFELQTSSRLEVHGCYIHNPSSLYLNHGYSKQFDSLDNSLIENNIFTYYQAGIILQGSSSGNVIAYNLFFDSFPEYNGVTQMLASVSGNHTPYPFRNLFEGNLMNGFHADFYYGPSGQGTLARNFIMGTDRAVTQNRHAIKLDSHQWNYNVVGNVLGSRATNASFSSLLTGTNYMWTNSSAIGWQYGVTNTNGFGYATNTIFRLGYSAMGNNGNDGWANPPATNQLNYGDLSVQTNTLIHGNYDFANATQTWDGAIADHTILPSYYLSAKPEWFGNRPWPPFEPSDGASYTANTMTNIPAGYRFIFGEDPPEEDVELRPRRLRIRRGD